MVTGECHNACPTACRSPFDRVLITRVVSQGVKVAWTLLPSFAVRSPLTFTLFFHPNAAARGADGWEPVGLPVVDQYYAIDADRRDWAAVTRARYKVRVEAGDEVFDSEPVEASGILSRREWLIVREAVRQRKLLYRRGRASSGFLLKRRIAGETCPTCADWQTDEATDSQCPDCFGTGFRCGYYYPQGCVWARFDPFNRTQTIEPATGSTAVELQRADMLAIDLIEPGDIWVNGRTDDRYAVVTVQPTAVVNGVPVAATVVMRKIGFSSAIYGIPIPQRGGDIL